MKISTDPDLHLTYCLNIHPGESFSDMISAVEGPASRVKAAFSPDRPFGLGIRLGAGATLGVTPAALEDFKGLLADKGMYVFTINGFPYGDFHGKRVKEQVYAPDWRTDERYAYTDSLVRILADLLPEGVGGSISTVPVSYASWIESDADIDTAVCLLVNAARTCMQLEEETGKKVAVALEPEPDCYVQSVDDAVSFFNEQLLVRGVSRLAELSGVGAGDCEAALRRYLGVCFDTCHASVQFEDPVDGLSKLEMEGISVPKVQVSSAIKTELSEASRCALLRFVDPVYFHQVRARGADGEVRSFPDLSQELLDSLEDGTELRTHFHVPLWFEGNEELGSTAEELTPEFFKMLKSGVTEHVEAETYTFDVLPEDLRGMPVEDSITKELEWVKSRL